MAERSNAAADSESESESSDSSDSDSESDDDMAQISDDDENTNQLAQQDEDDEEENELAEDDEDAEEGDDEDNQLAEVELEEANKFFMNQYGNNYWKMKSWKQRYGMQYRFKMGKLMRSSRWAKRAAKAAIQDVKKGMQDMSMKLDMVSKAVEKMADLRQASASLGNDMMMKTGSMGGI